MPRADKAGRAKRPSVAPQTLALAQGAVGADQATALLGWYDTHRRTLPWRAERAEDRDPYRTWLSEIMLQQTRVDTVIPYFERFLGRFPTVADLAAAPLDDVLGLWAGLGYYSRARNLHAAAGQVVALGGFPSDVEGLRQLRGVGPYVAGAIASMAFGRDATAVDGNVERVLSRQWTFAGGRKGIETLARAMLPVGRAGDFNQALMDLGSAICRPRSPSCEACPLAPGCQALAQGVVSDFPPKKKKRVVPERVAVGIVLRRRGRVLVVQRPPSGLFGGLFELPGDFVGQEQPVAAAYRVGQERLGLTLSDLVCLGEVKHVLTHMRLTLHLFGVQPVLASDAVAAPELQLRWYTSATWVDPKAPDAVALSTLASKSLALAARPSAQLSLPVASGAETS